MSIIQKVFDVLESQPDRKMPQKELVIAVANQQIVDRFDRGETLQSIGGSFGLTRERIRQVLFQHDRTVLSDRTIAKLVARVERLERMLEVRREEDL